MHKKQQRSNEQRFKVKQLADHAGVTSDVVRHYTRIGLLNPAKLTANGYKLYDETDLNRLKFIRSAKSLGYTLSEIATIVSHSTEGQSPCPMVREILIKRIAENRKKLDELAQLQHRMEQAVKKWARMPDQLPNGDSVCHLIEAMTEIN